MLLQSLDHQVGFAAKSTERPAKQILTILFDVKIGSGVVSPDERRVVMHQQVRRRVFSKIITNPIGSASALTVKSQGVEFSDTERAKKLLLEGYLEGTPNVHEVMLGEFNRVYEQYAALASPEERTAVVAQELASKKNECIRVALALKDVLPRDEALEHNQKQIDEFVAAL
jgi:hypothetical protein